MKRVASLLIAVFAFTALGFSQTEHLTTNSALELVSRHCQPYMETHHKFLFFGHKSKLTAAGVEKCNADPKTLYTSSGRSMQEFARTLQPNNVLTVARHCQKYMKGKSLTQEEAEACAKDDSTVYYAYLNHNLRTNAGADAQASQMGNTATQAASCNYIAVTNDSTAPAATDTTLASEIAANGLTRAQGTYAHTGGTTSFTVSKVFSATGTQASQKSGLFNAASSGTMCFENTYTAVTVNNGDTLTVTWTINI